MLALRPVNVPAVAWPVPYLVGLVPAVVLPVFACAGVGWPDPIKWLEHEYGIWGMRFLIAALCVTPVRHLLKVNLIRYRRPLALVGFYYVMLHLLVWLLLDKVNVNAAIAEVAGRPSAMVGVASLLILLPLAMTSNNWSMRRLGPTRWQNLQRFAYVAISLGALHFAMARNAIMVEPLIYGGCVAALLGWRLWRRLNPDKSRRAREGSGARGRAVAARPARPVAQSAATKLPEATRPVPAPAHASVAVAAAPLRLPQAATRQKSWTGRSLLKFYSPLAGKMVLLAARRRDLPPGWTETAWQLERVMRAYYGVPGGAGEVGSWPLLREKSLRMWQQVTGEVPEAL